MVQILSFLIFFLLTASLNSLECGIANERVRRILGGSNTSTSMYPWMVLLCYEGNNVCGGSLIDKKWIVTGGHCVREPRRKDQFTAFLGVKSHGCSDKEAKAYKIAKIYRHPNFRKTTLNNDIALLKLANPVPDLGSKNSPNVICLPESSTINPYLKQNNCKYIGWGFSHYTAEHVGGYPSQLQEAVATLQKCSPPNSKRKQVREESSEEIFKICSVHPKNAACNGDGGDPLMCINKKQWHLVGVESDSYKAEVECRNEKICRICKPGGFIKFTFVPQYTEWIKHIMKTNNLL